MFVLPNLQHPLTLGGTQVSSGIDLGLEQIAIVSARDERVLAIRNRFPEADRLLSAFSNEMGRPVDPAVLIGRDDLPLRIRKGDSEAAVAFRNAAAFSYLLLSRANAAVGAQGPATNATWSDTFDFHPTFVDLRGRLMTISPALTALGTRVEHYAAMPSPHVPTVGTLPSADLYLWRVLGAEWKRRYIDRIDDEDGRLLFRSLETAYLACSVSNRNQASLFEHGVNLGLWVSALETLAQRGITREVNQEDVRKLLSDYKWRSDRLSARRFSLIRADGSTGTLKLNAVQALANRLYKARHKFTHGSPVQRNVVVPKLGSGYPSLPRAAAIIYRAAIGAYLEPRYRRVEILVDSGPEVGFELFNRVRYDEALKVLISRRPPWF